MSLLDTYTTLTRERAAIHEMLAQLRPTGLREARIRARLMRRNTHLKDRLDEIQGVMTFMNVPTFERAAG